MESFIQELRYLLRMQRRTRLYDCRRPHSSAGGGAKTAFLSVANFVILRPFLG